MRDRGNPGSGKSAFSRGADLFASVMALVATFFLAPLLYHASIQTALTYAEHQFGFGWEGLLSPLWAVGSAVATFSICQMTIAASLRLGMARLATLLFHT